jgi:hypothetical protein
MQNSSYQRKFNEIINKLKDNELLDKLQNIDINEIQQKKINHFNEIFFGKVLYLKVIQLINDEIPNLYQQIANLNINNLSYNKKISKDLSKIKISKIMDLINILNNNILKQFFKAYYDPIIKELNYEISKKMPKYIN